MESDNPTRKEVLLRAKALIDEALATIDQNKAKENEVILGDDLITINARPASVDTAHFRRLKELVG